MADLMIALQCNVARLEAELVRGRAVVRRLATSFLDAADEQGRRASLAAVAQWMSAKLPLREGHRLGVLRCGGVERWPDGEWFFRGQSLGRDEDPSASMLAIAGDHDAVLLEFVRATRSVVEHDGTGQVLEDVLCRYDKWQATGVWVPRGDSI